MRQQHGSAVAAVGCIQGQAPQQHAAAQGLRQAHHTRTGDVLVSPPRPGCSLLDQLAPGPEAAPNTSTFSWDRQHPRVPALPLVYTGRTDIPLVLTTEAPGQPLKELFIPSAPLHVPALALACLNLRMIPWNGLGVPSPQNVMCRSVRHTVRARPHPLKARPGAPAAARSPAAGCAWPGPGGPAPPGRRGAASRTARGGAVPSCATGRGFGGEGEGGGGKGARGDRGFYVGSRSQQAGCRRMGAGLV